ncbi:TRAP transporter substrate-binding protein [Mesorhizobium sp. YM1C-6-2]|uniref:TRAP transporter substrate-binding protein n=1 Tax=Mesorhizobium sp. YM1C-6-2 TaxID=1827501 RepID=UPI000EF27DFF|nr:TRAP transporter substrate-binding protein [Mesorhizobium sp. YM1C-6-2]RLP27036.1 TRAP transporter substrate-binding protein [Mesorhizobium sp. YM1C-6-2]
MKLLKSLAAGAVIAMLGAGVASAQTALKIGHGHSDKHSFHLAMEKFSEILEQKAPGAFTVTIFPQAQLGSEREMQEQLTTGTLEVTITGVLAIFEPKITLLELPYLFRDREHIKKGQSSEAVEQLVAGLPAKGVRLVGFLENGFRNITNNTRPINTPEDVKGLKIRTPENLAQVETFNALGASPTPMAFSELYAALRQGVVDGQENPLQNIYDGKLFEVQKYLALTGHIYNSAYVLVSESFYQGLKPEERTAIEEALKEATDWQFDYIAQLDKELLEALKKEGMEVTEPDTEQFRAATAPAYDAFYAKFGDDARNFVKAIEGL